MTKRKARCVVLMPVGPASDPAFTGDTLSSVVRNLDDVVILIADNTRNGLPIDDPEVARRVEFLRFPSTGVWSTRGQLYYNVTKAIEHIHERFDFEVMLRLDDDALVIGPAPDVDALRYFKAHPEVGCLGSFRYLCTGAERSFENPKTTLRHELYSLAVLKRPRRWWHMRKLYRAAKARGYEDGEHCLAAASFFSRACVDAMVENKLLANEALIATNLCDDHMLGLIIRAVGFTHADFGIGDYPLGLAFRGLPMPPPDLVKAGKKIVHSLKDYDGRDQAGLREEFRRLVAAAA